LIEIQEFKNWTGVNQQTNVSLRWKLALIKSSQQRI
jgi:hypothetical protein